MPKRGCELLKFGRKLRGLTQSDVAESYGVNIKTYRAWETGQSAIAYDHLIAICDDVFKLPVEKINGVMDAA